MMEYLVSGKEEIYAVNSYDELLRQVKAKSPYTRGMLLEEYRALAINFAGDFGKALRDDASSKDIVEMWEELGVITIITR